MYSGKFWKSVQAEFVHRLVDGGFEAVAVFRFNPFGVLQDYAGAGCIPDSVHSKEKGFGVAVLLFHIGSVQLICIQRKLHGFSVYDAGYGHGITSKLIEILAEVRAALTDCHVRVALEIEIREHVEHDADDDLLFTIRAHIDHGVKGEEIDGIHRLLLLSAAKVSVELHGICMNYVRNSAEFCVDSHGFQGKYRQDGASLRNGNFARTL